jgi:carbamoyl-phosphate synthase large subunit
MGVGASFGEAFVKSQLGAGTHLPEAGTAFISVRDSDKARAVGVARGLQQLGFRLLATRGTARALRDAGIPVHTVNKVQDGRPNVVDLIKNGEIDLVVNTVEEKPNAISDSRSIRTTALSQRVTVFTTIAGAGAAVEGIRQLHQIEVYALQSLHADLLERACGPPRRG